MLCSLVRPSRRELRMRVLVHIYGHVACQKCATLWALRAIPIQTELRSRSMRDAAIRQSRIDSSALYINFRAVCDACSPFHASCLPRSPQDRSTACIPLRSSSHQPLRGRPINGFVNRCNLVDVRKKLKGGCSFDIFLPNVDERLRRAVFSQESFGFAHSVHCPC